VLLLATLLLAPSLLSRPGCSEEDKILKILDQQAEAWNREDLDAFMETYWNSEKLTYYSGNQPRSGWKATLERYRVTYQVPGAEMGRLEFDNSEVILLGPEAAMIKGRWHLARKRQGDLDGLFTLVLRRFPEGWKIIHDHSSS